MPAAGDRPVEEVRHVARVAVQPPFRLDEIEEEHAREGGERQCVPIDLRAGRAQAVGQAIERAAKGTKEAGRHAFARQHLADTERKGER